MTEAVYYVIAREGKAPGRIVEEIQSSVPGDREANKTLAGAYRKKYKGCKIEITPDPPEAMLLDYIAKPAEPDIINYRPSQKFCPGDLHGKRRVHILEKYQFCKICWSVYSDKSKRPDWIDWLRLDNDGENKKIKRAAEKVKKFKASGEAQIFGMSSYARYSESKPGDINFALVSPGEEGELCPTYSTDMLADVISHGLGWEHHQAMAFLGLPPAVIPNFYDSDIMESGEREVIFWRELHPAFTVMPADFVEEKTGLSRYQQRRIILKYREGVYFTLLGER